MSPPLSEWELEPDPTRAAWLFKRALLSHHETGKPLNLRMDIRESLEDQERALMTFYKAPNIKWACPLKCTLEGDTAVGEGIFAAPFNCLRETLNYRLLLHAVIGRTSRQIKQLRRGLKDTMMWPLLHARADVIPLVLPSESDALYTSQMIIERITWPAMRVEEDEEEEEECSLETKCRIKGYLRRFIDSGKRNFDLVLMLCSKENPHLGLNPQSSGQESKALTTTPHCCL
ncbi:hypothetical protein AOXY_G22816 [Acipenser oxyrinchus oxyrinchus]|uniref:Uncharacterized protein n=1 Tax=Acipenser oxyrinchus oxyrinchus TaxID=40147 RepID=A0AAD8G0W2_ACIOX|nr:hypothetical protein AOXY_G22816 [Acipenser oxyrinchus oxyrinchus]